MVSSVSSCLSLNDLIVFFWFCFCFFFCLTANIWMAPNIKSVTSILKLKKNCEVGIGIYTLICIK